MTKSIITAVHMTYAPYLKFKIMFCFARGIDNTSFIDCVVYIIAKCILYYHTTLYKKSDTELYAVLSAYIQYAHVKQYTVYIWYKNKSQDC